MSVLAAYDALVASGDSAWTRQRAAAERLNVLQTELEAAPPRGSLLWRLTGRKPERRAASICGGGRPRQSRC